MHKVHKKVAYRIEKSLFFLRPFYVLSTSFLRNGYMEVAGLHILYIFEGGVDIDSAVCGNRYFISGQAHQETLSVNNRQRRTNNR